MRKCFPEHFQNQPADMAIKMFVLGNPGAGKSTLVKSLQTEGAMFSRIKHRFTKVTDVDERTAGIIPYDIESKALGRVTLYDFAGHREFYAGHDALLRNSMTASPSIVVLVIDMRGEEGLIRETLQYWFEFINIHSTEGRFESHLVILGSHTDCLSSGEKNQKVQFLRRITSHHTLDNISIVGQVMLDCRYAESSSISQLRSILMQSCKALRSSETIAIAHRCFLVFLFDKYRDQPAVRFSIAATEMMSSVELDEYAYLRCLKSSNLIEICEMLNKRDDILFMKNNEDPDNSWIVFDKSILLSQVNGVIFAPEGFKEHQNISTSTGVVPLSILASLFPGLDRDMICQFLCHLEFCHEITDPEILALLQAKTDSSPSDEKFFFFPGLVDLNVPPSVWQPNSQFGYHSGWLLQCIKPEQFLSPRFLQVLVLRLAYSLAFVASEKISSDSNESEVERNCYVWKCGICWSDTSGLEIFVEVVDQKSIIVLTRSLKEIESQTRLTFVRSQIVKRVLDTRKELCPKVTVKESFLHPEDAISYPLGLPNVKVITIKKAAQAIVEGKLGVLDSDNQMVNLKSGLLCYEPYLGFQQSILDELFKEDDKVPIEDVFLFEIAKCMHKNTDYIIELFKTCPIRLANLMDRAPPGDVHRLVRVFQLWREEMGAEATRYNLRKQLDQFSVFAGRNPLGLCV
jgi:GTPase SAR1 family protein